MNVTTITNGFNLAVSKKIEKEQTPEISKKREELSRQFEGCESTRELMGVPVNYTATSVKGLKTEDLFDIQYLSATKLSDGSRLIRPVCLSLGKVDIVPTGKDNKYIVRMQAYGRDREILKEMSEKELLTNRSLSKGTIKKSDVREGEYDFRLIDVNGKIQRFSKNKKESLEYLKANLLYM